MPLHKDGNAAQVPQRSHVGTGTGKCGTSTKSALVLHSLGVPAQPWGTGTTIFGTGTIASATAPLHCSTTRGLSTAAVIDNDDLHLFSGTKSLRKCARDSKNLHTHKNSRTVKSTYSTQNESKT